MDIWNQRTEKEEKSFVESRKKGKLHITPCTHSTQDVVVVIVVFRFYLLLLSFSHHTKLEKLVSLSSFSFIFIWFVLHLEILAIRMREGVVKNDIENTKLTLRVYGKDDEPRRLLFCLIKGRKMDKFKFKINLLQMVWSRSSWILNLIDKLFQHICWKVVWMLIRSVECKPY